MKFSTAEAQIEILRKAADSGFATALHRWLIALAIALALLSALTWNALPLLLAAIIGMIGASRRRAVMNLASAIQAYDSAESSPGIVTITIAQGDGQKHYHAKIQEGERSEWGFEFHPQDWSPAAGIHSARIWRHTGYEAPALAVIEDGILVPRYAPIRLTTTSKGEN